MERRAKGFTLLELMVVLAIAGIAIAVVAPRFSGAIGGVELKKQSRQLMAVLRHARTQSMSESLETYVVVEEEGGSYRLIPGGKLQFLPVGYELQVSNNQLAGVTLQQAEAVYFYPDGSSSGGEFYMQSESGAMKVEVSWLTGKVSVNAYE